MIPAACELCQMPFLNGDIIKVSGHQWPRIYVQHASERDCIAALGRAFIGKRAPAS